MRHQASFPTWRSWQQSVKHGEEFLESIQLILNLGQRPGNRLVGVTHAFLASEARVCLEPDGESKAERRLRKQAEKVAETRPMEAWERYRALSDLLDHMLDVVEMADRRTRFALVLLGTLNAANILMSMQANVLGITGLNQTLVRGYVGLYLLLSLYFLVHAVIALKPRSRQMGQAGETATEGLPGLRLVDDILSHPHDMFYELWRTADIGTLNRELSLQVYLMARTTAEKFAALRKVYTGVLILLALTALFVVILGLHAWAPTFV